MQEHVVYFFSGTGNSLKVALTIQKALGDCAVVSMGMPCGMPIETTGGEAPRVPDGVKSIGFVFPCYFGSVPSRVLEFIAQLGFPRQQSAYVYAVVTYGAVLGNTLGHLGKALKQRDVTLDYTAHLKAFANYVAMYDMSDKVAEMTAQTKADLQPIVADILGQRRTATKRISALGEVYGLVVSKDVHKMDRHFVVRASCDGCGICERVCPVHNIRLEANKPRWLGHCEQCMACVQWCPRRAIDYGEKTRRRGRYTNPEITSKMFIDHLNNTGHRDNASQEAPKADKVDGDQGSGV